MNQFLQHALRYASRGWHVFPLKPRSKEPATGHGFKDSKTLDIRIREWWKYQDHNVGIATGAASGFIVIDIDDEAGMTEWQQYGDEHGTPLTLTAATGGGGLHVLFRHPGIPITNRSPFKHIHIRGDGGYIVAPPSIHPSGNDYRWVDESVEIADCPQWLLELLVSGTHAPASAPASAWGRPLSGWR